MMDAPVINKSQNNPNSHLYKDFNLSKYILTSGRVKQP